MKGPRCHYRPKDRIATKLRNAEYRRIDRMGRSKSGSIPDAFTLDATTDVLGYPIWKPNK